MGNKLPILPNFACRGVWCGKNYTLLVDTKIIL